MQQLAWVTQVAGSSMLDKGGVRPPVQVEGKMDAHWWIQQVTTRVSAVTCWIQQPVSPKHVVGFACLCNVI